MTELFFTAPRPLPRPEATPEEWSRWLVDEGYHRHGLEPGAELAPGAMPQATIEWHKHRGPAQHAHSGRSTAAAV